MYVCMYVCIYICKGVCSIMCVLIMFHVLAFVNFTLEIISLDLFSLVYSIFFFNNTEFKNVWLPGLLA